MRDGGMMSFGNKNTERIVSNTSDMNGTKGAGIPAGQTGKGDLVNTGGQAAESDAGGPASDSAGKARAAGPRTTSPGAADAVPGETAGEAKAGGAPAQRGRPRSEQADRAIMTAALELLAERGIAGMSIEEVASRAGVGKATIYRRWSSKGALTLDAFLAEFQGQQPLPDTGSLRGDLRASLRAWVHAVTRTPVGRMLADLIGEIQHDKDLAATYRERVLEPLRQQHRIMLDRAIARGEIPADTDREVALDLMFGAAQHRLLLGHLPLTERFVGQVVDVIMAGLPALSSH